MGRILALDFGTKRTGIAVTDPQRIIATPLEFVPTNSLFLFLDNYLNKEIVDIIVVSWPTDLKGQHTNNTKNVVSLKKKLELHYSKTKKNLKIDLYDERFTSKMSLDTMITLGMSKKKRNKKSGYQDKISATLILQSYMDYINRHCR